jgi:hypothetical protein
MTVYLVTNGRFVIGIFDHYPNLWEMHNQNRHFDGWETDYDDDFEIVEYDLIH